MKKKWKKRKMKQTTTGGNLHHEYTCTVFFKSVIYSLLYCSCLVGLWNKLSLINQVIFFDCVGVYFILYGVPL